MSEADLLIRRARMLTLGDHPEAPLVGAAMGELGVVADGWLAARSGVITAVGDGMGWRNLTLAEGAVVRDLGGRVLLPGFVDPHTHLCYGGQRWDEFAARRGGGDYLRLLAGGGGIHATVRATTEASEAELHALLVDRLRRAATLGTTTIEVKSGYGLEPAEELRQLRLIAKARRSVSIDVSPTYLAAHALPPSLASDRSSFLERAAATVAVVSAERLAESVDAFVERGVFSVDEVRPLAAAARRAGLTVRLHADQLNDVGACSFAAEIGAGSADHVSQASDAGLLALARAGVPAVLLPGSSLFVGYPAPDFARFASAGVAVAIGTDHNPGTSPLEGMPTAIALAVSLCRLTPQQAIAAATLNAAHALGRGGITGALVPGRRADLITLETDDERELAYRLGVRLIDEVYAAGRLVPRSVHMSV